MCGIAGILSAKVPAGEEELSAMAAALAHRGPDARAVNQCGPLGLAHTRLAVIDTRDVGRQPMSDSSGEFVIVFNGEIYNFLELRSQLAARGAEFKTNTDTEVILESYKAWGERCVERLVGMFAFGLWDKKEQQLLLARDRLGQKPLFYAPLPCGGLIFASELKAILASGRVERRLDLTAVSSYISLNYGVGAQAFVRGVNKLAPATTLTADVNGRHKKREYWNLSSYFRQKRKFRSERDAIEEFDELLLGSVQARLISDVPLGAFLSGGIDSSAVVAAMNRLRPAAQNSTFSIGFREPTYSELPQARALAEHLGVSHHEAIVDADMAAVLPEIVYFSDEPFADTSIIPLYYLSKFARESVTVCLSGDGGDEILAGYTTYVADRLNKLLRPLPQTVFHAVHALISRLPPSFGKVSIDYKLRQFLKGAGPDWLRSHYSWREICADACRAQLLRPEALAQLPEGSALNVFSEHSDAVPDCHYLDRAMYVDIKTWLADDILVKVDRASMAHSLEARAPFLDHRLVEFAAALPVDLKLRGFTKKYILRRSQARYLPPTTIRRRKEGFNAPIAHWLASPALEPFYREMVENPSGGAELFDKRAVRKLWDEHTARRKDNSLKLFALIVFDQWCKRFAVSL